MKVAILVVCALLCLVSAKLEEKEYQNRFNDFVVLHNKEYASAVETVKRYNIFKANVDWIEEFNRTPKSFQVGITKFADLTNEEYRTYLSTYTKSESGSIFNASIAAPTSIDWRTKGAVTGVKDQGQCGSCWSFSTTGSVEGCHFITTGKLVSLSEQNLVDCSSAEGNQGCNGGLMDNAFKYIQKNHGIDLESCYPYHATDGTCKYKKTCCGSTVTSFSDVPSGNEQSLVNAIATGPVSVAIDASQQSFQLYTSGVYYAAGCSSSQLDHGVLAVGYGEQSGHKYYIVKNSWGTGWGEKGYILMSRDRNNNCGIATAASMPHGCNACAAN
jgi:cathepsin L